MREISSNVPYDVELDQYNLKMMDEVWTLLKRKYGQVHELTNELVKELMQFTVSN